MNLLNLRLVVLSAFVLAMPIFALPVVNQWVDATLFGASSQSPSVHSSAADAMGTKSGDATKSVESPSTEMRTEKKANQVSATNAQATPRAKLRLATSSPPRRPAIDDPAPPDLTSRSPLRRLPPADTNIDSTRFLGIQQRLQELGATYFVLERTSPDSGPFRFHCRMSLPGTTSYERPFEASHEDPLAAMRQVLNDVEQWTASRTSLRR